MKELTIRSFSRFSDFAKKNRHVAFFAFFLLFQWLINSNLALFGDDFYYSTFVSGGRDYFLSENIRHYLETNGRAFVHLIDQLILCDRSLLVFRIFSLFTTGLTVLFGAAVASGTYNIKKGFYSERFKLSLALMSVLFSFISIFTAYQTLYWVTGYLNYVFPVFLTLSLFFFTEASLENGRFSPWLIPLAFFASCTTEQCAFVSLCTVLSAVVRILIKKKKPSAILWSALALAAVGFVILFAAPGNSVRTTYYADFYAMPLFRRILKNIAVILRLIFHSSGASRAIALFFTAYFASLLFSGKKKSAVDIIQMVCNAAAAALLILQMHIALSDLLLSAVVVAAVAVLALDIIILICNALRRPELYAPAFFSVAAVAIQGAMLISPEMGPRTVFASIVFLSISAVWLIVTSEKTTISSLMLAMSLFFMTPAGAALVLLLFVCAVILAFSILTKKQSLMPALTASVSLVLAFLMLTSLSHTLSGYKENKEIHMENDRLVSLYKDSLKNDPEASKTLRLKYLKNGIYKYAMPYEDPYQMYWYKRSVGLIPEETEIIYE